MNGRRPLLWVICCGIILSLPVLLFGFPYPTHDGQVHEVWYSSFATQLWAGDLYPRWLQNLDGGLGGPTFYFYPPAPLLHHRHLSTIPSRRFSRLARTGLLGGVGSDPFRGLRVCVAEANSDCALGWHRGHLLHGDAVPFCRGPAHARRLRRSLELRLDSADAALRSEDLAARTIRGARIVRELRSVDHDASADDADLLIDPARLCLVDLRAARAITSVCVDRLRNDAGYWIGVDLSATRHDGPVVRSPMEAMRTGASYYADVFFLRWIEHGGFTLARNGDQTLFWRDARHGRRRRLRVVCSARRSKNTRGRREIVFWGMRSDCWPSA